MAGFLDSLSTFAGDTFDKLLDAKTQIEVAKASNPAQTTLNEQTNLIRKPVTTQPQPQKQILSPQAHLQAATAAAQQVAPAPAQISPAMMFAGAAALGLIALAVVKS